MCEGKLNHRKSVLIVEDRELIANLEKRILEKEGFKVEVARDGVEGLERIRDCRYDVIISDLEMPRMKGDELYLEVKRLNGALAEKIIFVSGHVNDFIRSTGNSFLSKPFTPQKLVQLVKDLLN